MIIFLCGIHVRDALANTDDEVFPVQQFFLWTTYNLSYILFIGHKLLFD